MKRGEIHSRLDKKCELISIGYSYYLPFKDIILMNEISK